MGGRGRLIALEGIDGSGKTTQARLLAGPAGSAAIGHGDRRTGGHRSRGRAPRPAARPRTCPRWPNGPRPCCMAADRAQHVAEVVAPGPGRRALGGDRPLLGVDPGLPGLRAGPRPGRARRLVDWATAGIEPDLNVLVDVPVGGGPGPARGRRRRPPREPGRRPSTSGSAHGYLALAAADPERWVVVDGTGAGRRGGRRGEGRGGGPPGRARGGP